MENTVTCPFCRIQHTYSNSLIEEFVCPNCNVGLRANIDYSVTAPTTYQKMPDDNSLIAIGSKITFKKEVYKVYGKIRYQLETTIISKWVLINNAGSLNYLFEFTNGFALTYKNTNTPEKLSISTIKPTKELSFIPYDAHFQVKAIYKNYHTIISGEVVYGNNELESFNAIELINANNEFAFLINGVDNSQTLYTGDFIELNELVIEEPAKPNNQITSFECTKCNAPINNYLKGKVFSLVCSNCNSHFTFDKNKNLKFEDRFAQSIKADIPIGSKGEIEGKTYTVIGYLYKREKGASYKWKEYNLIDGDGKIATLSEFNGHYNLIEEINYFDQTNTVDLSFTYQNKKYHKFNKYGVGLISAQGEFTYFINNDDSENVVEYVSPPNVFIFEKNKNEARFYHGRCILPKQIKKAFEQAEIPEQIGTGATQTMFLGLNFSVFKNICFLFLTLILAIQIYFSYASKSQRVFSQAFQQSSLSDSTKVIVTNAFQVNNGPTALQFDLVSNVYNNWFGVTLELINDNTGERFEVDKTIEFYSGVDGGETWSEGSKSESVIMSQVPTGKYHINLYPEWGSVDKERNNFELWVYEDVSMWSNFWFTLIIASVLVFIHYIRFRIFESKRWMESNFDSPYITQFEE